uniref:Uncharacterized protein n=1 Tax=Globodera rostochiensis TaxID=31243 RepID=A0A914HP57_GLORO
MYFVNKQQKAATVNAFVCKGPNALLHKSPSHARHSFTFADFPLAHLAWEQFLPQYLITICCFAFDVKTARNMRATIHLHKVLLSHLPLPKRSAVETFDT